MTTFQSIDLRTTPSPQGDRNVIEDVSEDVIEDVIARFDKLADDEAVVVIASQQPKTLLQRLQTERPGRFEWNVLERNPETYRVELVRRTGDELRAVTEWFEADHRRLDRIMLEMLRLVAASSFAEARALFEEFVCGLDRHIDIEEAVLFPLFEESMGTTQGPTAVMRYEHTQIRQHMDAVTAALDANNIVGTQNATLDLESTLCPHNSKEEHILYPMIDRAVGDEQECDALVRRCQAM